MKNQDALESATAAFHKNMPKKPSRLEAQLLSRDAGFPLGGTNGFPWSWPFNARLETRFKELLLELSTFGITMKMGVELELSLSVLPEDSHLPKIEQLVESLIAKEKQPKRLSQIQDFLPRDFLMLDLYENDETIKESFDYKFGYSQPSSYYDNPNVFEFNTKPLEAEDFFKTYLPAQKHLLTKFLEYGFSIQGHVAQQLSVSFWRDGRNIILAETRDDDAFSARIFDALGSALNDGHILHFPSFVRPTVSGIPVISPSRVSIARHAQGRIELKGFALENQHLLIGAVIAAGAAGIANHPNLNREQNKTKFILTCGTFIEDGELPWLRHAINASIIDPHTGQLVADEAYLRISATKILNQINPDDPAFHEEEKEPKKDKNDLSASPKRHIDTVRLIIASARISKDADGYKIRWPENKIIPVTLKTCIDFDRLNAVISCVGVSKRALYQSAPYHLKQEERLENLRRNNVIRFAFGKGLAGELTDAIEQDLRHQNLSFLAEEFLKGIKDVFRHDNKETNEKGNYYLQIPVMGRSVGSVERGIKQLFKVARENPSVFGDVYRFVTISHIREDADTGRALSYVLDVLPENYFILRDIFLDRVKTQPVTNSPATDPGNHLS